MHTNLFVCVFILDASLITRRIVFTWWKWEKTFLLFPSPMVCWRCRPALPGCLSSAYGCGLILCRLCIVPRLFCSTEWSRSLTETMALIWMIKGVRHYDTVSLCRGWRWRGQHTNIQGRAPPPPPLQHPPPRSPTNPSLPHNFLVPDLNKLQAWTGPWMWQARLERSSLELVMSSIGVSEKSLLGLPDTCLIWHIVIKVVQPNKFQ